MHRLSIAFACVAGVFASQASLADSPAPFYMAKANTSVTQFRQDRDDCISMTTEAIQGSSNSPSAPSVPISVTQGPPPNNTSPSIRIPEGTTYYKPNVPEFIRCMKAKGYQESPTGPKTGLASQLVTAPRTIIGPRLCVRFSRADTRYSTFMYDRNDCLESKGEQVRDRVWLTGIRERFNLPAFVGCMNARGYALDPNGYRALVYQKDAEDHIWGLPLDQSCSPISK